MVRFESALVSLPGQERTARHSHGGRVVIHATAAETGGAIGMWDTFSAPGTGPPLHMHTRETEVFRVITGIYRFRCGDQVFDAPPGTTVTLPPHIPHEWKNISEEFGHMFAIVTPGGFEEFFIEIERRSARTRQEILEIQASLGVIEMGE